MEDGECGAAGPLALAWAVQAPSMAHVASQPSASGQPGAIWSLVLRDQKPLPSQENQESWLARWRDGEWKGSLSWSCQLARERPRTRVSSVPHCLGCVPAHCMVLSCPCMQGVQAHFIYRWSHPWAFNNLPGPLEKYTVDRRVESQSIGLQGLS